MRTILAILLCASWAATVAVTCLSQPGPRQITTAETVLAVYVEDHGLASRGVPRLVMAVWGDGYVVWSSDNIHGGGTYFSGHIAPRNVADLVKAVSKEKLFTDPSLLKSSFGPDSRFTTIYIKTHSQILKLSSWHELAENGNVVATDAGLEALNGRSRTDVMDQASPAYKRFRATWNGLRARIIALKPTKSKK